MEKEWEYRGTIKRVEDNPDYYLISTELGFGCFSFSKEYGVVPKVGDKCFLGTKNSFTVRGLMLNGVEIYYKTDAELQSEWAKQASIWEQHKKNKFEAARPALDRSFLALPDVFQRRISRFRANNPDFRWKYESYEMWVCEEAVRFTTHFKTAEALLAWAKLPYDKQQETFSYSDGHSGNTYGCAVRLAELFITQPENVVWLPGAMAAIVGSKEYGCVPRVPRLPKQEGGNENG